MTQRIFDKNNPQDMKDLFDILPDDVEYVYPTAFSDGTIGCYGSNMWAGLPIVVEFPVKVYLRVVVENIKPLVVFVGYIHKKKER